MALAPEASILGGLAVGGVVVGIHQVAKPSQADIQALPAGTPDIDRATKTATWLSVLAVSGIALMARDAGIFIIGSAFTVGLKVWSDHSNHTESIMGRYLSPSEAMSAGTQATGPAPAETEPYQMFAGSGFQDD
ncbi:hypothetical protein ACIPWE_40255 [Streptomyces sp. NPDC090073]|uniref:hypothetical protein n=1 Tax=Streptomyces sp. NPDC090073 TaxID=3365936 RepID=UPI003811086D